MWTGVLLLPGDRRISVGPVVASPGEKTDRAPRRIVLCAIPVARIPELTPCGPSAIVSAAGKRRRPCSSRTGASTSKAQPNHRFVNHRVLIELVRCPTCRYRTAIGHADHLRYFGHRGDHPQWKPWMASSSKASARHDMAKWLPLRLVRARRMERSEWVPPPMTPPRCRRSPASRPAA